MILTNSLLIMTVSETSKHNLYGLNSCHNAEKNWKGDHLVSPGIVCYAEKEEKSFWFSSLG